MKKIDMRLYLGGARSGKSAAAEHCAITLAATRGQLPLYLATGQAFDDEMKERITVIKTCGKTVLKPEEPFDLAAMITSLEQSNSVILIDSVGIWLTNMMMTEQDWRDPLDQTIDAIKTGRHQAIFVSDDVGGSIVPENAMARQFRDHIGLINQRLASEAKYVTFVVAGIETRIK